MEEPLLSVCLITHNHANFIRQAIEGVLMQKVDFTWELVIADDFSADGTRDVVLEYKKSIQILSGSFYKRKMLVVQRIG